ncbi:MAG: helix-turn-helix transcriptional regulator [Lachnospiraceae bacterium]|nr:helix-turn-helix transcriptional regulator [Lachnospiraceae bacterium]
MDDIAKTADYSKSTIYVYFKSKEEIYHQGIEEDYLRSDINIIPAVFTLWASLGSLITVAHEKEAYILRRMNMKRDEFLHQGFEMLLNSVRKEQV